MKKLTLLTNLLFLFVVLFITSCGGDDDDKPVGPGTPEVKPPNIKEILPVAIYATDAFDIKGEYFGDSTGKILLTSPITSIEASVISWNDTAITANFSNSNAIQPGEYKVKLQVNDTLYSNEVIITIIPADEPMPLQIVEVLPLSITEGDTITVTGTSLGETPGTLLIGETPIPTYNWTDVQISAEIPNIGATGQYGVKVIQGTDTSNIVQITFTAPAAPAPHIASLSSNSVKPEDTITITGNYFGDTRGTSYVMFGTTKLSTYPQWNNTSIKTVIPQDAVTGDIKVVVNEISSNTIPLTITQPAKTPKIIKLDKEEYVQGANVIISGENFGTTRGKVFISPNTEISDANVLQWRDTNIRLRLPMEAKSGQIWVRNSENMESNKYNYAVIVQDVYTTKLISKGSFLMGNDEADDGTNPAKQKPAHQVTITYDFYMATTEVTQKQFKEVMQVDKPQWNNDQAPAYLVTFADACEFCNKLSENIGLDKCYIINGSNVTCNFEANGYRLPTEAEWEYAARAGNSGIWGFDAPSPDLYAWYSVTSDGANYPLTVAGRVKNKWDLYDMHGNAAEWVWDVLSSNYYQECIGGVTNPIGPANRTGTGIVRGGHIQSSKEAISGTARDSFTETQSDVFIGFRFVRKR